MDKTSSYQFRNPPAYSKEHVHSILWPYVVARFASLFSIVLGMLTLLAWTFVLWLPQVMVPYLVDIRPNVALCFFLIGVALWIRRDRPKPRSNAAYAAQICCALVFLISFISLFEYFFNVDFGVDMFFKFYTDPIVGDGKGGVTPFSATNFVLLSFVLFFLDERLIRFRVHQLLIMIVLGNTYFQLLTHIFSFGYLSEIFGVTQKYSQASMIIIISFLILSLGTFFVRPYKGVAALLISKASGGILARRMIPFVFVLPVILGYLTLSGEKAALYSPAMGISLLIMSITIIFALIILAHAYMLNRVDVFRQTAEFTLMQKQLQLQAILDHTSASISINDLENRFLLVNKQFEKLFHVSAEEVIGKRIYDIFPDKMAETAAKANLQVIDSRAPITMEDEATENGNSRNYLSHKAPLLDQAGIPYAVCTISTDVTEINEMHEALREREQRLRLALTSAEAGTWSWDLLKNEIVWDEYFYKLFGLKEKSLSGSFEATFNFIHPDDRKRVQDEVRKVLIDGTDYESEYRILMADGSVRYLAAKGHVFRDANNLPVRMAGICYDVTERKVAEEELRRSKEMAEDLAERAEEASRAKTAFLAAMSHEIRTPLNGIIGMTGLVLDTPLSGEQRESLETIRVSSETLLTVINDILDFSKIESERMELESIEFDIYSLIEDAVDMIVTQVQKKGIALGAWIDPDVPIWLCGDPIRIRQVLTNILNNAAKFTEQGEISVHVKKLQNYENESGKNEVTLLFEISDTGIGIAPEIQERLFKPFSQGDISTSRKYGGSGLGLIISKRLVDMMGGSINLESFPGRGSKFWFTVNLLECPPVVPSTLFQATPELANARILCVDDSNVNREAIKSYADSWQMRCDVAADAAEGLSKLMKAAADRDPYVIILVDYIMTGMSGLEMIKVIRELKEIADTPIILLSSLGIGFNDEELKKYNIIVSLSKPIHVAKLYESILYILKNTHEKTEKIAPIKMMNAGKEKNKYKILLAEDNNVNRQVALRILTKLGYQADAADNGLQAIEALKKNSYDLILMDCQMPEMDGYTATEEIRKLEKEFNLPSIPVIAMTAHALKGDREKCIAAGMDDYLSKPIDIKALSVILEHYLKPEAHDISHKFPLTTKTVEPNHSKSDTKSQEHPHARVKPRQGASIEQEPLLDQQRIKDIFQDNTEAVKEFMGIFVNSTEELLVEIENAVQKKDIPLSKELVHRLKGSSGNSGVVRIQKLCIKMEEHIMQADWDTAKTLLQLIKDSFEKVKKEIAKEYS